MTQQLYKAVFAANTRGKAWRIRNDAMVWLDDNSRKNHYVQHYHNDEHVVFVLSDRDTALMLKMAIQP